MLANDNLGDSKASGNPKDLLNCNIIPESSIARNHKLATRWWNDCED